MKTDYDDLAGMYVRDYAPRTERVFERENAAKWLVARAYYVRKVSLHERLLNDKNELSAAEPSLLSARGFCGIRT